MTKENKTKNIEIYRIIDSFLVEAKNQYGEERSLEQMNQDRHLAAERFMELFQVQRKEVEETTFKNVSFLRQWLNEDCITDPKKMVTNEDIMSWLKND